MKMGNQDVGRQTNLNLNEKAQHGGQNPFAAHFVHFLEIWILFHLLSRARPVNGLASQQFYRAAKRPAPS